MSQTQIGHIIPFWAPIMRAHGYLPANPNTVGCTTAIDPAGHPYPYVSGLHGTGRIPQPIGCTTAIDHAGNPYSYVSGLHGTGRVPQPAPMTNPGFPAANLINSTGGAGIDPGYNYFFPTEHANVIVLKSKTAPWKLTQGYDRLDYWSVKIPGNVTMRELLVGFGAGKRGAVYVVYQQGDGKWEHMESVEGRDEGAMRKSVREMGWLKRGRDGRVGVRYIWVVRG